MPKLYADVSRDALRRNSIVMRRLRVGDESRGALGIEGDKGKTVISTGIDGVSRQLPALAWLAASIILLGLTLQVSDGHFSAPGIIGLSLSCLAVLLALRAPKHDEEKVLPRVLGVGLLLQFGALLARPAGVYFQGGPALLAVVPVAVGLMAVLVGTIIAKAPLFGKTTLPLVFALFGLCCAATLLASPEPRIDVFVFQKTSAQALLRGLNPYALEFPNIYGHTDYFGPGVADARWLHFGFVYPPLSLLFSTLAQGLFGDVRVAQGLALLATLVLLTRMGGSHALLAALLFLSTPRIFFVLEQSWTEPFAVLLLASCLMAARRWPRLLPLAFGLLLAIKQYTFILIPLTPLLLGFPFGWQRTLRFLLQSLAVALVVTLPFVLWNPAAFYRSVLWLQTVQPFRVDTLGFLALWTEAGHAAPPVVPFFVAATLLAAAWALRRFPATPEGFAAGAALVLLGFFAFNKQAFCNSYFFVLGALSCALAAGHARSEPAQASNRTLRSPTSAKAKGESSASAS